MSGLKSIVIILLRIGSLVAAAQLLGSRVDEQKQQLFFQIISFSSLCIAFMEENALVKLIYAIGCIVQILNILWFANVSVCIAGLVSTFALAFLAQFLIQKGSTKKEGATKKE